MSGEVLASFIGLSVFGVAFGMLIPDNGCKNALRILLTLVITAALLKIITGIDITSSINNVMEKADVGVSENNTYGAAGEIISELTKEEVFRLVEEFTGNLPVSAECSVLWAGEEFVLADVEVVCRCENPTAVMEYLALKLGIDGEKIRVVNMSEKVDENAEGLS